MRQALVVLLGLARFEMNDLGGCRLNAMSSLSASISRYVGLKMSVQVNCENKPVPGHKNTDVFLLSSLVIAL